MSRPSRSATIIALAIATALLGGALVLTRSIPVEKVLGTRIYLPIFHGASTWVDIMLFVVMGVFAVAYLITRREGAYAWEVGFRAIAAPLWLINTGLGLMAALGTWDFTASKSNPFAEAIKDPRLSAQFWLLMCLILVLALLLLLDKLWQKSLADLGYLVVMAVLLGNVLINPEKRALHPDNPVLNSGLDIKGPFFGIVACLLLGGIAIAWLVRGYVRVGLAERPAEDAAERERLDAAG
jgi:hypothetical protein